MFLPVISVLLLALYAEFVLTREVCSCGFSRVPRSQHFAEAQHYAEVSARAVGHASPRAAAGRVSWLSSTTGRTPGFVVARPALLTEAERKVHAQPDLRCLQPDKLQPGAGSNAQRADHKQKKHSPVLVQAGLLIVHCYVSKYERMWWVIKTDYIDHIIHLSATNVFL